ncbi:MAG: SURF1 family protein [Candidatus Promineifilaceae bacterium]|nr:SURF1 family protein [Candidatus Promineifilaceae bacterium]
MKTLKLLFSRRWWWVTLLVILGMGVLARLGIWQLNRLEQRRAANAALRQQLAAGPISLNDPSLDPATLTEMSGRAATATGRFDLSEQMLLQLQKFEGAPGGHLIAPLRLDGREEAVLVDRGWIPEVELAPENWSQYDVAGTVTVTGTLRPSETARGVEPPSEPQQTWYRVNVDAIGRQLPYDLFPVYLLQSPPPEGNVSLPYREEVEVDLSEGPHLSYAIQWFAFTLMLGAGYVYYVYRDEYKVEYQNGKESGEGDVGESDGQSGDAGR